MIDSCRNPQRLGNRLEAPNSKSLSYVNGIGSGHCTSQTRILIRDEVPPEVENVAENSGVRKFIRSFGVDGDGAVAELEAVDGFGHIE